MSLRRFLILATLGTVISWVGWLTILFYINPATAGSIGLTLFYLALFFALAGTFTLLGFFVRVWFTKEPVIYRHVGIAVRQSVLFSILVVGSLMLQGNLLYSWWSAALLLAALAILELFFLSRKPPLV